MNKFLLFILLICLLGYTFRTELVIDKELKPYYNRYNILLNKNCNEDKYNHPRSFTIGFTDLKWPVIGLCSYNYFGTFRIDIDRRFWNSTDMITRLNLFEHEATHCAFSIGHSPDPNNYMAPVITHLNEEELTKQVNALMKELCK